MAYMRRGGYEGDGRGAVGTGVGPDGCQNIDECMIAPSPCDQLVTCTDTDGSYSCGDCPAGYTGGGDNGCMDIDECDLLPAPCDRLTSCSNEPGSFDCGPCPPGYSGTGSTGCLDIDDCDPNPRVHGGCTDQIGGYLCTCAPGWDGVSCDHDIDYCSPNICQNDGICTELLDDFSCDCASGWSGRTCDVELPQPP